MTALFFMPEGRELQHPKSKADVRGVRKAKRIPNPTHFTDDGISGTLFDRPAFTAMMEEVIFAKRIYS